MLHHNVHRIVELEVVIHQRNFKRACVEAVERNGDRIVDRNARGRKPHHRIAAVHRRILHVVIFALVRAVKIQRVGGCAIAVPLRRFPMRRHLLVMAKAYAARQKDHAEE